MKKFTIIVKHLDYEENWATTNDYNTAVRFAIKAIIENKGKQVRIQ